jgi:hypothetical protein
MERRSNECARFSTLPALHAYSPLAQIPTRPSQSEAKQKPQPIRTCTSRATAFSNPKQPFPNTNKPGTPVQKARWYLSPLRSSWCVLQPVAVFVRCTSAQVNSLSTAQGPKPLILQTARPRLYWRLVVNSHPTTILPSHVLHHSHSMPSPACAIHLEHICIYMRTYVFATRFADAITHAHAPSLSKQKPPPHAKSIFCSIYAFTPKQTCNYSAANQTTTRLQHGHISSQK